ncbi:MAG TPA: DUF3369 domain-containing protein [Pseudobacteroides sp.]|uniref:DUF3369 domain-containing protein n=1 Tax=Pseudobacteroides sp. TaxID=1968840 RepID=UPI002F95C18F
MSLERIEKEFHSSVDDEMILLLDNDEEQKECLDYWNILVVDDEASVHSITKIILEEFKYGDKGLKIYDAYTEEEAMRIITEQPEIAVVLLDVVMNSDDSGFKFIKYVREELGNKLVRIILRTGQPGQAPERKVIIDYDINDYKLKSEITADRLFVSVFTALRSYNDMKVLEDSKKSLEKIIKSSHELYKNQSFNSLIASMLLQLNSILIGSNVVEVSDVSILEATKKGDSFYIESAVGCCFDCIGKRIEDALPQKSLEMINKAVREKDKVYEEQNFVSYFQSSLGSENIIFIKNNKEFNELERDLTEIFCSNISMAFDNFYLKQEINTSHKEIIFTLGEIAETRSNETGFHVKRVAEYSRVIAIESGLSEEEAELISIASTMHDVGKLGIPDSILNKPGKLTSDEFECIKTHSSIGYNMLKHSKGKIISVASVIALQHHEKYDGTGYPNRLSGEEIDLHARIVAIADVFDALASKRVYKESWDIERIIELFKNEAGKHFDPRLTAIFLNNIDYMLNIKNSFPD